MARSTERPRRESVATLKVVVTSLLRNFFKEKYVCHRKRVTSTTTKNSLT